MKLETIHQKDLEILEISGRFDIYSASDVRTWFEQMTREKDVRIIVDLSSVMFIDSTGLAMLVQAVKRAREHHGDLCLCGLQQPVRMVLELTRLDKVFEIFPTRPEAVQRYAQMC